MAAKRGREPQGEFAGKSAVFSTRITPQLRKDLERAAKKNKRSVSQEVERRLRDSFEKQDPYFGALAQLLSWTAFMMGASGEILRTDPCAFSAFQAAVDRLLLRLKPSGDVVLPDHWSEDMTPDRFGWEMADSAWNDLTRGVLWAETNTPPEAVEHFRVFEKVRRALGVPSGSAPAWPQVRFDKGGESQ